MMVRNEADIIEASVRHNLACLDLLVVIDHGSFDGTSEILRQLAAENEALRIVADSSVEYRQSRRTTDATRKLFLGDGADFVLLLADMAPAIQGDQIAGCTPPEAALAVDALAGLHGPSWCDEEWLALTGIAMPKPGDVDAGKGLGDISVMAAGILIGKLGASMSIEDQETFSAAMSLVTPWLMAEPQRYALMHGDYRLDNMLFGPDRTRITVVDWQTVGIGLPARDLAYFTATSLEPGVRAEIERDLVGRYHRALSGSGVADYDLETCWHDYRLGVVQAPLLAGLGFAFAASTERGDEMMLTMLHRGCRAIRELDTLDLIKSYQSI